MTKLFQRDSRIQVDELVLDGLDVQFEIQKSLKPEPNTCEIRIFNLNPDHRNGLEEKGTAIVQVDAGYVDGTSQIFLGELRDVASERSGPDIVTTISSGDGEKKIRSKRVNLSLAPGTDVTSAFRELARALELGKGNVDDFAGLLKFGSGGSVFPSGTVLSGNAAREMQILAESVGLEWSVQDGAIQLLRRGKPLLGLALDVGPDTGLIGTPSVDQEGLLSATLLMAPGVFPGVQMVLRHPRLAGVYRVETTRHVGDTAGQEWYVEIEAKRQ